MDFESELERIIDQHVGTADDRDKAIEEVSTALELKLAGLREEEPDEDAGEADSTDVYEEKVGDAD